MILNLFRTIHEPLNVGCDAIIKGGTKEPVIAVKRPSFNEWMDSIYNLKTKIK
ncbi:MAG: hypothetical protein ABI241_00630 [Bacteroidia bacterium]